MSAATAYLTRETRALLRVGERADQDNRRAVVAYMVSRLLVPKRWGKLRVFVEGEPAPPINEDNEPECVGLIWAGHADRRYRWVVRYRASVQKVRGRRGKRAVWVEQKRVEIPAWDATARLAERDA